MAVTILAIESSCDDTSVAVLKDGYILSNLIANQDIHMAYGGVVPELASRAHQVNIVPVTDLALKKAGIAPRILMRLHLQGGPDCLVRCLWAHHLQRVLLSPAIYLLLMSIIFMLMFLLILFLKETGRTESPLSLFFAFSFQGATQGL